ncbi:DotH/IcmK family type IV secretion protein [Chromobacterium haemolyticum]|uniref:DotH/IcmK family type IV secretion protein n=1 Tax=Chromobacterium haemolyticum TaxID=394935 RepID=UPI00244C40ED|nr:DotH/IcmK family type IV secretion protein [Chromobacterium haemolyticum]MDH0342003.1 DotH/IcmK family type IV secretion protein [Chromobacterium haemolyticum]
MMRLVNFQPRIMALAAATIAFLPCWANADQPAAPGASSSTTQAGAVGQIPAPGTPLPNLPKLPNVTQEAYKQVTEEAAPLSPEQIKTLRRLVDDAERAASTPPRFIPKPVSSSVTVSLMPGETPPVVRLFSNYVTNILFVDQVGNPLLVTDFDPGGAASFTVTTDQKAKQGSNLIKVSPKSTYAMGNISVSLDGVQSPVSLTLVSGQREVDYRVDVRVKGVGTGRGTSASAALPSGASPMMQGLLEGIAPDGAKPLVSSNGEVQAWEFRNRFYVRTSYTLLSPAYLGMQKSADGSAVYEITPTPVLIALSGGGTIQINLSGY